MSEEIRKRIDDLTPEQRERLLFHLLGALDANESNATAIVLSVEYAEEKGGH